MKINTKPLSVNKAWKGKRYRSNDYKSYQEAIRLLLKNKNIQLPKPPFYIKYIFAFSNPASDIDNPIKPLQDILCEKYNFNDRDIYKIEVEKRIVKKGDEYIEFEIEEIK